MNRGRDDAMLNLDSSARRLVGSSLPHSHALSLFLLALFLAFPAAAQEPDTTEADTLRAEPEAFTTEQTPPGFARPEAGTPIGQVLPIRRQGLETTDLLAEVPGSFTYDFGAVGWPHGWSPFGLPPHQVSLRLDGRPFDDPVTGRPRFDLLPLEFLLPLRIGPDRLRTAEAVYADVRPFNVPRPFTELRYRSSDQGMQAIAALHTQQRQVTLLGREGVLGILFGYYGRAADNEYSGSDLRTERRLLGRLRFERPTWSAELVNLRSRRSLGAQGGVLPQGNVFETVYLSRADASVRNPNARRRLIRNDLALTVRTRLAPAFEEPLTASVYRSGQFFRYRNPGSDTLAAQTARYGATLRQEDDLGAHRVQLRLEGYTDRVGGEEALSGAAPRTRFTAGARDSLRLFGLDAALDGAFHTGSEQTFFSGALQVERPLGGARLFASASLAGQPMPWAAQEGLDSLLMPVGSRVPGAVVTGRAGLSLEAGLLDATLFAFGHQIDNPLDFYVEGSTTDTVQARVGGPPFRRVGLTVELGLRREARRGLYATARTTLTRLLDEAATADHPRASAALPGLFGEGRLGARFVLFRDLDIDAYAQGRFWTEMRSRTLHPATGLLALPPADARTFGPDGTVSLFAEAGIRTATIFLAYENALSGTTFQWGTLLVPVYPLPAQRFRFGVYWPIFD